MRNEEKGGVATNKTRRKPKKKKTKQNKTEQINALSHNDNKQQKNITVTPKKNNQKTYAITQP